MDTLSISWLNLLTGCLLILIPAALLFYFRTGLSKPILWAFLRMCGQLFLAGIYLNWIFDLNSYILNFVWVIVMIFAAAFTIINRSDILLKKFILPVIAALGLGTIFTSAVFLLLVIGGGSLTNARYVIPVTGMIIGNCLTASVIGIRSFYKLMKTDIVDYKYRIACGADRKEAVQPFIKEALIDAFGPTIANMSAIGLIWLPGMMTGQILGGSSPMEAIKYQILIMTGIAVGSIITVVGGIIFSMPSILNKYDIPENAGNFLKKKSGSA